MTDRATSTASTSSSLIRRVKARDAEAWHRLVALYGPLVYRWARQAGLQDSDAADVMQEVFRGVANGIANFRSDRPNDSFRGWLWTITQNAARRLQNRRRSRPEATGGTTAHQQLQQAPDIADDSLGSQELGDSVSIVHRALEMVRDEFEERTWQAFWRSTVAGQSASEIAQELGMTEGAVRQAKYRVLGRLRGLLDEA
jgi:RNA polymerase sigma-70 factor (ECF subfamily)